MFFFRVKLGLGQESVPNRLLNKINSTGVTERPGGSGRLRSVRTSKFRFGKYRTCGGADVQS